MKLQNPILITLNNVPHIKADNLEPVEVDSSCTSELETIISKYYRSRQGFRYSAMVRDLFEGLPISELLDRIEVREERILLAKSGGYKEGSEIKPATIIEGNPYKITYKAFLLPVKEEKTIKFKVGETLKLGFQDDTNGVLMEYTGNDILFVVRKDSVDYKISSKRVVELDNKEAYTMKEVEKAIDNLPISGAFRNTLKRLLAITLKK